jgi:hypothetical protein
MQRASGSASTSAWAAAQSAGEMGTMLPPAASEPLLTETLTSVRRWPRSRRYSMLTTRGGLLHDRELPVKVHT